MSGCGRHASPGRGFLFSLFAKGRRKPGLTAVGLYTDGACVARVVREPGTRPVVDAYEFRPWDGEDQVKVLSRLSARYNLKRNLCTTPLNINEYKLLLTEAPDVRADELRSALRWRLKDLIDFHVNDAALDAFELPQGNRTGQARAMFAVVAENRLIQARVDLLHQAGIALDVIDIPELAQRNIAALTAEDASGTACLSLTEQAALITITRRGELYFARSLDVGLALLKAEGRDAHFERIVLEIQRSLDYFDAHFREAPVAYLLLDPNAAAVPELTQRFGAGLNVKVRPLDLAQLFEWKTEAPTAACLQVLGAALREEKAAL